MSVIMRRILFFAYFLFSLLLSAHAQKLSVNVTNVNSANGLSQNSVLCIFKDRYGFMWFGTQDGLNKYDGLKFIVYKHLSNNPKTLPANLVNTICDDADGNIWVGTRLGGLSKYDRSGDSFVSFKNDPSDKNSLISNDVNIVYRDRKNNLWVGTTAGLDLYDKKTGKFRHFISNDKDKTSLSNSGVMSIFEGDDHNLWIGTVRGLNLLNRSTGTFTRSFDSWSVSNDNTIYAITQDQHHNIWVGAHNGLELLDRKNNKFISYKIQPDKDSRGGINPVYSLAKTAGNKFWIGSNTTLQLFDVDKKQIIPLDDQSEEDSLMPNDGIYSLLEDKTGILWIGTSSEGVTKYDKNLTIFPSFKASLTNTPNSKNIIRGIVEDKNNNLYLATDNGLDHYDRSGNNYIHYQHSLKNVNSLASNYTASIAMANRDNTVWVGTYSNGCDHFDPATRTFKHFVKGNGPGDLSSNAVYALLEDKKGNIWIGTDSGGVNMYDPVTKKITRYQHDKRNSNSLCDNTVQALFEDKDGNIWMGGFSNGISVFDPKSKKFTHLNDHNSGLNSNVISCFYQDKKGTIWVGTMEGGLNKYNGHTRRFTAFTEQNGLINNTVNYIAGDESGYLWLSTLQGITRFDPVHIAYKNYGIHNGLKNVEFNVGSGLKLQSGEIAFGGINGFNVVDPKKLSFNHNKPVVAITGFELFNKKVTKDDKDSPLKENILTTKQITLQHSQSVFTIEFAALDFTVPENNKYAYKLEPFDGEWRYVGNQRKATYTNLDPGTYTFLVKAANNDGVWGKEPTMLKITIVPPYWMAWWFRGACVIFIVGLYYSFYLYRMNFVKKQKAELEKQVVSRTQEIQQQTDRLRSLNSELRSQKEELQTQSKELRAQSRELYEQSEELHEKTRSLELLNQELSAQKAQEEQARLMAERAQQEADKANTAKSAFLATMSHEIRTPMNGVLGMASLLSETPLDVEQREYTDAILNSGETLLLVINDILDFSKIESGNLELDPHDFNLRKCIEDVLELFASKAAGAGIDLVYQIDDTIPADVIADSLRLRQVLTNLIGNAIKFTHKGEVFVTVTSVNATVGHFDLSFEIKDTGIGISEAQLSNLFQAFNQVDSSVTRKYGGTGLGLVICQRLVKLMGGDIKVKSKPGEGSTFSFTIKSQKGSGSVLTNTFIDDSACEGKQILVVDDNDTNLRLLKIQLKKWKMQVVAVSSGSEALAVLSAPHNIDAVITDMQMPDMDGIELSTRIKTINSAIPIILLSSIGNEAKKTHPNLFTSVLTKPVKQMQLFNVIAFDIRKDETVKEGAKKTLLSDQFAIEYPFNMLIAEDNLMNQKLIIRVLNKLGYQPELANDGQEALDMLKLKPYDLVLMDIQMPNIDGLEATRIIRKTYEHQPLICAMTANALSEDKDNCFNAGMDDYMSKPISIEALMNKLTALFEKKDMSTVSGNGKLNAQ